MICKNDFLKKNVFKSLIILSTFLDKNISIYIPFPTCTYVLTSEKKPYSVVHYYKFEFRIIIQSHTYYTILNKILIYYCIPTKTQLFSRRRM